MRYANFREVEMALGDPNPRWPLLESAPKFSADSFASGRPFDCEARECECWSAGIELVCQVGDTVLLPEACTIEAVEEKWSSDTTAVFATTADGELFLVFAGLTPGSSNQYITPGPAPKGTVIGHAHGTSLHFETYVADHFTVANEVWYASEPPPLSLLNPLNYIQRAAKQEPTLESWRQIRDALRRLGFPASDSGAWTETDIQQLQRAQRFLGLPETGEWDRETEARVRRSLKRLDVPTPSTAKPKRSYVGYGLMGFGGIAAIGGGVWLIRELRK